MSKPENTKSYLQLIGAGRELFWKHGVSRITVEEICKEAGVSKMTFYRNFKNKTELAKVILNQIMDESIEKYRILMAQDIPYPEKVRKSVELKFESTKEISAEFIQDVYKNEDLGLLQQINVRREEWIQEYLNDMKQAQKEGWVRKDIKPEFLLYLFQNITEMAMDPLLTPHYKSPQDLIMEVTQFFFYGIMEKR